MDEKLVEKILSMPDDVAAEMLIAFRWTETEIKNLAFDGMIKQAEEREDYETCDRLHTFRTALDQLQERLEKEGKLNPTV